MFADYAGDKLSYFDRKSGKEIPVETFVAILGAGGLTYVEGSSSQEKEDWIRSDERAFLVLWLPAAAAMRSFRTHLRVR